MKKSAALITLIYVAIMFLGAAIVQAQTIPNPIQNALSTVFIDFHEHAQSADQVFSYVMRFMLFIIAFALFNFGLKKLGILGDKNKQWKPEILT